MANTSFGYPLHDPDAIIAQLLDRIEALETKVDSPNGPAFIPEQYSIRLGRPTTVIHRLGNGLLVTDVGPHEGAQMKHMFFATNLDFANHLIAVAAKKELEK